MLLTTILLLVVNSICLAVNSTFFDGHNFDLSGLLSEHLSSIDIDYVSQKYTLLPSVYFRMPRKANWYVAAFFNF